MASYGLPPLETSGEREARKLKAAQLKAAGAGPPPGGYGAESNPMFASHESNAANYNFAAADVNADNPLFNAGSPGEASARAAGQKAGLATLGADEEDEARKAAYGGGGFEGVAKTPGWYDKPEHERTAILSKLSESGG